MQQLYSTFRRCLKIEGTGVICEQIQSNENSV
jgi:hypothetical protein